MLLISFLTFYLYTFSITKSLLLESEWESFKKIHGKSYSNPREELYRRTVFHQNLKRIEQHNEEADQGIHTYRLGITKFTDLTENEWKSTGIIAGERPQKVKTMHKKTNVKLPESVDWRSKGILTKVKNQGSCPACWAFSTVAAIEAAYAQKTGKLVELSEQNIVDCVDGAVGCKPYRLDKAYEYAQEKGLDSSDYYPYTSEKDLSKKSCKFNQTCAEVKIEKFGLVPAYDEEVLAAAVAKQVITVMLYEEWHFADYTGGILNPKGCYLMKDIITHAVALVGYGTENGTDYWIFKNSYGDKWGENGYGRLLRGNNTCNIVSFNSYYPII